MDTTSINFLVKTDETENTNAFIFRVKNKNGSIAPRPLFSQLRDRKVTYPFYDLVSRSNFYNLVAIQPLPKRQECVLMAPVLSESALPDIL